jgi:hypothetical protein
VWKDATGAQVPVITWSQNAQYLGEGVGLADSAGNIWEISPIDCSAFGVPGPSAYFASTDCSGPAYITYTPNGNPPVPRQVFKPTSDSLYHVLPDSPTVQQVSLQSSIAGNGTCQMQAAQLLPAVPLAMTALPSGTMPPTCSAPLHPEYVP